MAEKKKRKPKVCERFTPGEIAYVLRTYLAMGEDRTLIQLREILQREVEQGMFVRLPSLISIRKWSQKYGWTRKSKEYDRDLQSQTAVILSTAGKDVESLMRLLRENAALCLKRIQGKILETPINKAIDLKHMTEAASRFMDVHESLRGTLTEAEDNAAAEEAAKAIAGADKEDDAVIAVQSALKEIERGFADWNQSTH